MEHILTVQEYKRMADELSKVTYKCACGHKEVIPSAEDKKLCSWCGHYVFKDKKDEFRYRVKEKIRWV